MEEKKVRLYVFVGAYGSGKSEVSVHFAHMLKQQDPSAKVMLADLDIVNPYYRSADAKDALEAEGIRVIVPEYANTNVDVPALSGEVYSAFDMPDTVAVFDIGGEDMGALVLGSLKHRIENTDAVIYMAVNSLRPFTSDPEQIAIMTSELSAAAGFKIDGYINNTNLLEETTAEMVKDGESKILEASKITGVPLVANCVMEGVEIPEGMLANTELFRMSRRIHYAY
jgi:hypothetical protein